MKENRQWLANWVEDAGYLAVVAYMVIYATMTAFSVPGGAFMSITGGLLFGLWLGCILTVVSATIGAIALFLVARYTLANLLRQRVGFVINKMEAGFNENPLSYMLFLRLIPVFPFFFVNLVPALLRVRLKIYVIGTFFGIIPGSLVYTWLGDSFGAVVEMDSIIVSRIIFEPRFLFPIIGLATLVLLPVVYKKLNSKGD